MSLLIFIIIRAALFCSFGVFLIAFLQTHPILHSSNQNMGEQIIALYTERSVCLSANSFKRLRADIPDVIFLQIFYEFWLKGVDTCIFEDGNDF
jgi:hypothetical protein